jgi:hypothetical protein
MGEHILHGVQIAIGVVAQGTIENGLAAVFQKQVVGEFGGVLSGACGPGCDACGEFAK